jgi:hypothetical protein
VCFSVGILSYCLLLRLLLSHLSLCPASTLNLHLIVEIMGKQLLNFIFHYQIK